MAWRGQFRPKNPQKYVGDVENIVYRSRIELRYMQFIDQNDDIVQWCSEEIVIPYIKPTDLRTHRYFPDLLLRRKDGRVIMVELKHSSDLTEPTPPKDGRGKRRFLGEMMSWNVNQAKWAAARAYCADRGWEFMVLSERELGKSY